jgi:hypothetical protein
MSVTRNRLSDALDRDLVECTLANEQGILPRNKFAAYDVAVAAHADTEVELLSSSTSTYMLGACATAASFD